MDQIEPNIILSFMKDETVERLYCKRPIQCLACVFQNIDPPPPHHTASVSSPAPKAGGVNTRRAVKGWGINILENARYCSVLYIRKYVVDETFSCRDRERFNTSLDIFGTVFLLAQRMSVFAIFLIVV
jgi:hypothetical protein